MNRHFQDSRYYLKRAVESAAMGVRHETAPIEARLRELTGREKEPEPTRLAAIREELEASETIVEARTKLQGYRKQLVH